MNFLINIDVEELQRGIDFYTAAFGLCVGRRFSDWVELVGGPTPIYLLPKPPDSVIAPTTPLGRNYARHWTPVHLDLVVDDIDAAIAKAVRAGARLEQEMTQHKYGKLALLADPFGHGFCFIQFEGRGYDEIAR